MVHRKKNYSKQPHLWLRKETMTWYIAFRNGSKKVRICTKTRDKREAGVALDRFLKTEYHIPGFERRQITLHQGISDWLKSCERSRRGLALSTLRSVLTVMGLGWEILVRRRICVMFAVEKSNKLAHKLGIFSLIERQAFSVFLHSPSHPPRFK